MKYTVTITEETNGNIRACVPAFPQCAANALTRTDAINKIRKAISEIVSRTEIIQIDVDTEPKLLHDETQWNWFGAFKNDPTWDKLFDEIERQRNS